MVLLKFMVDAIDVFLERGFLLMGGVLLQVFYFLEQSFDD